MIWEYGGTNKEHLLPYIPAIIFTLYDGYFLYTTTNTTEVLTDEQGIGILYGVGYEDGEIDDINTRISELGLDLSHYPTIPVEGNSSEQCFHKVGYNYGDPVPIFEDDGDTPKQSSNHMLKSFTPYAVRYKNGTTDTGTDITVNYTLDNYVRIYGTVKGNFERRAGYLVDPDLVSGNVDDLEYNGSSIKAEILTEQTLTRYSATDDEYYARDYRYVYSEDNSKLYYDDHPQSDIGGTDNLNQYRFFRIDSRGIKAYLADPNNEDRDSRIRI